MISSSGSPEPLVTPARRRPSAVLALAVAAIIAVGGLAFAAGSLTASPVAASGRSFTGFNPGAANAGNGTGRAGGVAGRGLLGAGGLAIQGTVASISADSLTLTLDNGQTVQFGLSGTTTYYRRTAASSTDVATGDKVLVQVTRGANASGASGGGASASAGSRPAQSVTLVAP